jgi:hypothetical protein
LSSSPLNRDVATPRKFARSSIALRAAHPVLTYTRCSSRSYTIRTCLCVLGSIFALEVNKLWGMYEKHSFGRR